MNLSIVLNEEALADLAHIVDRLSAESGSATSDRFVNAVTRSCELLALMPGAGALRNFGPNFPGLRLWPIPKFSKYLIIYRVVDADLEIVRVLHGAQNLDDIFA